MTIELKPVQPDPYDAVIADLRAKRDELDSAIGMLEKLRDGRLGFARPGNSGQEPSSDPESNDAGMFLGMSIVDATKKLLKLRKRVMGNAEITKELQAGGLALTGADPVNVVSSVLTRRFNNVGDVVRVDRGQWGLKEWYPGRTFKGAGLKTISSTVAQAAAAPQEDAEPLKGIDPAVDLD